MEVDRVSEQLDRLEAAVTRLEERRPAERALADKHDHLRVVVEQAVRELDQLAPPDIAAGG